MNENDRNKIIAECAAILDHETQEWNAVFFDFLESHGEEETGHAMTKAMTYQDAAEMVRKLNPDYKAKRDEESKRIRKWAKELMAGNSPSMPQLKDN